MDKHVRHIWRVNIKNIVAHAVIQPQFVPLMYSALLSTVLHGFWKIIPESYKVYFNYLHGKLFSLLHNKKADFQPLTQVSNLAANKDGSCYLDRKLIKNGFNFAEDKVKTAANKYFRWNDPWCIFTLN